MLKLSTFGDSDSAFLAVREQTPCAKLASTVKAPLGSLSTSRRSENQTACALPHTCRASAEVGRYRRQTSTEKSSGGPAAQGLRWTNAASMTMIQLRWDSTVPPTEWNGPPRPPVLLSSFFLLRGPTSPLGVPDPLPRLGAHDMFLLGTTSRSDATISTGQQGPGLF